MADVWDGGTATTGIIKTEFNTDHTAIRFTRTDAGVWPADIPATCRNAIVDALKLAIEGLERAASSVDSIDSSLAASLRSTATAYRAAGGIS